MALLFEMAFLLSSDHLGGGCLKDFWDGCSLSKLGLALVGFSISTNPSSQLEELHKHLLWLATHFSQYSPIKFNLFSSTLFNSSSVWETLVATSRSVTT